MCGIIGILRHESANNVSVASLLLDGLRRLEYRGYDSAGIAMLTDDGRIERQRAAGKLKNLTAKLAANPLSGHIGIGHTRWATHGIANETNAHPHITDRIALVHNGIIENFQSLRTELTAQGVVFESETDSESVAHLISHFLAQGLSPQEAMRVVLPRLQGTFALAILFMDYPDLMIGARNGSPLAVGYGPNSLYLGSDALALASLASQISYLEEGDWVELHHDQVRIHDCKNKPTTRPIKQITLSSAVIGKGNHRHFMEKEIHEQPTAISDTLHSMLDPASRNIMISDLPVAIEKLDRITIIACGTAYYAGLVGKYWLEQYARIPVEVDIASEFRYRKAPLSHNGVSLVISQSGETADTLAGLRYAQAAGQKVIGIVNVAESSIAREADGVLPTMAGPEIGVASTKAFTTQLTLLALLALDWAGKRGKMPEAAIQQAVASMIEIPRYASEFLAQSESVKDLGRVLAQARCVLYLGRGAVWPIALEGALKLKEISYIQAEGHAAGEMKHGPIALIDENVPVIAIAPHDRLFEKTASNIEEAIARGGRVILVSDAAGIDRLGARAQAIIEMPCLDSFIAPILYALPMQLLAYYTAIAKGTDVDQPRNLAKSVTVE